MMRMKPWTLPVWFHSRYGGRAGGLRRLQHLLVSQWWSAERLRDWQLERLREVVGVAATTPYYREVFARIGLSDPRDLRSAADLEAVPELSRETVRDYLADLTLPRTDLVANHTGGSTGIPLKFYLDSATAFHEKPAANARPYCAAGYRLGEPMAVLWGMDRDVQTAGPWDRFVRRSIYGQVEFNAFAMTQKTFAELARALSRDQIGFVKGYAGALEEFSVFLKGEDPHHRPSVRAVFSEAETLDERRRSTIEGVFGARVFDIYGSREFGTIGFECGEHQGLHVNAEQLYVEVRRGEVLVTSLVNRGTVFLRYAIGDIAGELKSIPCPCGRSSPRLIHLGGRKSDNFVARDGKRVHGEMVTHLFYNCKAVEKFQIVQKSPESFVIRYVTRNPDAAVHEIEGVRAALGEHFGYPLEFTLEHHADLGRSASGKFRFTISEVQDREV